eukprot:5091844-Prymnesium_polylepis.2
MRSPELHAALLRAPAVRLARQENFRTELVLAIGLAREENFRAELVLGSLMLGSLVLEIWSQISRARADVDKGTGAEVACVRPAAAMGECSPPPAASVLASVTSPGVRHSLALSAIAICRYILQGPFCRWGGVQSSLNMRSKLHAWRSSPTRLRSGTQGHRREGAGGVEDSGSRGCA